MDKKLIVQASRLEPVPDGLSGTDTIKYCLLQAIYRAYRADAISMQEGESLKRFVLNYQTLNNEERISLLHTCIIFNARHY